MQSLQRSDTKAAGSSGRRAVTAQEDSADQQVQQEIARLKRIDAEVRAHERAHRVVGGQYAGQEHYEYSRGPDGQQYAVGGEVSIDISKERDPQATIAKMQTVRAAAMAPANPSAQDMSVAATATNLLNEAMQELARQEYEKIQKLSQKSNTDEVTSRYA